MSDDLDLIVVGGGGAGLCAALTAADAGGRVLVLESEQHLGGSTRLSSGIMSAAGTSVQRGLGIEDTADAFFQHYMDLNQWRVQPGRVREFCVEAAAALEWLLELGVEIPATWSYNARQPGLNQGGVSDVWRSHVPAGEGAGVIAVLERALAERPAIRVEFGARVDEIEMHDGRVIGARSGEQSFFAPAVVVASGGISHDDELLRRYYPRAAAAPSLFRVAAPGSRGDHIRFAEQVGAAIEGTDRGLLLLAPEFQKHHHWTAGFPPKARIIVGSDGRRFVNEDVSYSVSTGIFDRAGGAGWMIFDEDGRLSLSADGFVDWTPDVVLREAARGETTVVADSIDELARAVGVPESALRRTVERWNDELPEGRSDSDYFRDQTMTAKGNTTSPARIETAPFYATLTRPSELICTHAGLEIDGRARVIDRDGDPIPGLFAAGEAGGGILGESYVGGGNAVANAITMGRVAGREAVGALHPAARR